MVAAHDLDLHGRQRAGVEDLPDHATRLEEEIVPGKAIGEPPAQLLHVGPHRRAPPFEPAAQLHANEGRVRTVVRRVDGRPARVHAHVRQDQRLIVRGDERRDHQELALVQRDDAVELVLVLGVRRGDDLASDVAIGRGVGGDGLQEKLHVVRLGGVDDFLDEVAVAGLVAAEHVFHDGALLLGLLDAGPARRTHVDREFAGIDFGKQLLTDAPERPHGRHGQQSNHHEREDGTTDDAGQAAFVARGEALVEAIETRGNPEEKADQRREHHDATRGKADGGSNRAADLQPPTTERQPSRHHLQQRRQQADQRNCERVFVNPPREVLALAVRPQYPRTVERRNRPRHQVRRQHGEGRCHRQRREQVAPHPFHE